MLNKLKSVLYKKGYLKSNTTTDKINCLLKLGLIKYDTTPNISLHVLHDNISDMLETMKSIILDTKDNKRISIRGIEVNNWRVKSYVWWYTDNGYIVQGTELLKYWLELSSSIIASYKDVVVGDGIKSSNLRSVKPIITEIENVVDELYKEFICPS